MIETQTVRCARARTNIVSVINNINIGIYRNTTREGRFVQANPAMAKMFGYDSVEEFMENTVSSTSPES